MASPTCQVKDGAGSYVPTTDGVNVTPAATITIALVSSAGVNSWSITCIGTDENQTAAAINALLTVDGVNKTATFTMPAAGTALVFRSTVTDTNGTSTSETFGIFTLTTGSLRVGAVGEGSEGSAAFGWTTKINAIIRDGGPTVATADDAPVYVTLVTLAVGEVAAIDVIATVAKADGTVRQSFRLSALVYGAAGPTATLDGGSLTDASPRGTGAAVVELDLSGADVRLKITGIAATNLTTTYQASRL